MIRLSSLFGKKVYAEDGKYLGEVCDVVIDLASAEVARLTLESIPTSSREDAKRVFREKTFSFSKIRSVGEIILVFSSALSAPEEKAREQQGGVAQTHARRYHQGR